MPNSKGVPMKLAPNTIFSLNNKIDLKKNQIVSKKLFCQDEVTISLFSFDENESVSEQSNSEDIVIFVLEGELEAKYDVVFRAHKNQILAVPKNTLHQIHSTKQSKIMQITTNKGDQPMANFINKVNTKEVLNLKDIAQYEEGGISSIALVQRESLTLTIFAFDAGEHISTHSSTGDALVQVLEGTACIDIDGTEFIVSEGESIVMPANTPHAVSAKERFKMMLTVVKPL